MWLLWLLLGIAIGTLFGIYAATGDVHETDRQVGKILNFKDYSRRMRRRSK
jgi:hypothetical protein